MYGIFGHLSIINFQIEMSATHVYGAHNVWHYLQTESPYLGDHYGTILDQKLPKLLFPSCPYNRQLVADT